MENIATKKRIIISMSLTGIFIVIGLVLYYLITPAATCFDKKQNQAEKGVDCGGTCTPCGDMSQKKDIVIDEVAVVLGGNNTYDVVAKITNPNGVFGAGSFDYTFTIKDANDAAIATRSGNTFILPADSKYVAEFGVQTENGAAPAKVELIVNEIVWGKLDNIGKPQINVVNKNFGKNLTGIGSEATGVIRNESGYDLGKINIMVILRAEDKSIVGVSKTEKNSVRSKEERDFRLTWPYQLSGSIQNIEVDAQSNVFDPQNFTFSL